MNNLDLLNMEAKKNKSLKLKHFLETVILILEDKSEHSNRTISPISSCILIFIVFSQYTGYVFNTFTTKSMNEYLARFFAHWFEYSPATFFLYVAANDFLTLVAFMLFQLALFSYLFYIVFYTVIRRLYPHKMKSILKLTLYLNSSLQLFFSVFNWIFYIPFTEINCGIIVCGENSFLTTYRDKANCEAKPTILIILGGLGIALTCFTGNFINYFYQSNEFLDRNCLKRRFNSLLFPQTLLRSLLVILYYINLREILVIKHLCVHFMGFLIIYDYLKFFPFKSAIVSKFYLFCALIFESLMSFTSLWELTSSFPEYNLSLLLMIVITFSAQLSNLIYQRKYNEIIGFKDQDVEHFRLADNIVWFFEEIQTLAKLSESDKLAKLKLVGIYKNHTNSCVASTCICKHPEFHLMTKGMVIDDSAISDLLSVFFKLKLKEISSLRINKNDVQYLQLKYCSFLSFYQQNPVLSHFELKMLSRESNHSNTRYFKYITRVFSNDFARLVRLSNRENEEKNSLKLTSYDLVNLIHIDNLKKKILLDLSVLINKKIDFWEMLIKGVNNIDIVSEKGWELVSSIQQFSKKFYSNYTFDQEIGEMLKGNIIMKKLEILQLFIATNNPFEAYKKEKEFVDMRKKDLLSSSIVSSNQVIRNQIAIVLASLLPDNYTKRSGRIINNKDENLLKFFGYKKEEFERISNLKYLMPSIYDRHDEFMIGYISEGRGPTIRNFKDVFAQDRAGYIFPVKLMIDNIFYDNDDCSVGALISKKDTGFHYIIFDKVGGIHGCTQHFYKLLGITKNSTDLLEPSRSKIWDFYECANVFFLLPMLHNIILENKGSITKEGIELDYPILALKTCLIIKDQEYDSCLREYKTSIYNNKAITNAADFIKETVNFFTDNMKDEGLKRFSLIFNLINVTFTPQGCEPLSYFVMEITEVFQLERKKNLIKEDFGKTIASFDENPNNRMNISNDYLEKKPTSNLLNIPEFQSPFSPKAKKGKFSPFLPSYNAEGQPAESQNLLLLEPLSPALVLNSQDKRSLFSADENKSIRLSSLDDESNLPTSKLNEITHQIIMKQPAGKEDQVSDEGFKTGTISEEDEDEASEGTKREAIDVPLYHAKSEKTLQTQKSAKSSKNTFKSQKSKKDSSRESQKTGRKSILHQTSLLAQMEKAKENEAKSSSIFRDNKIPGFFKEIMMKLKEKIDVVKPENGGSDELLNERRSKYMKFFLPSKNDILVKMNSNLGEKFDKKPSNSSFSEIMEEETNLKNSFFSKLRPEGGMASSVGSVQANTFTSSHLSIIHSMRIPRVMKSFILLLILNQVLFMVMSITYILRVKDFYFGFESKISDLVLPYYMNIHYSQFLAGALDGALLRESNNTYIESYLRGNLSDDLMAATYQGFVAIKNQIDRSSLQNILKYESVNLELKSDQNIVNETVSAVQFFLSLAQQMYNFQSSWSQNNLENLVFNFLSISNLSEMLFTAYHGDLETDHDSTKVFFIVTCSLSIVATILIACMNYSIMGKCKAVTEKIILIVTRITETEVLEEIHKLRSFLNIFKTPGNDFLLHDFMGVQKSKIGSRKSHTEAPVEVKAKAIRKGYLSTRIYNQKLSKASVALLSAGIFLVLVLYYSLVLYLNIDSINSLNNVLDELTLDTQVHRMMTTMLPLSIISISKNINPGTTIVSNLETYEQLSDKYKNLLKTQTNEYSIEEGGDVESKQSSLIKNENLCLYLKKVDSICNYKKIPLTLHGVVGYLLEFNRFLDTTLEVSKNGTPEIYSSLYNSTVFSDFVLMNFMCYQAVFEIESLSKTKFSRSITKVFQKNFLTILWIAVSIAVCLCWTIVFYFRKLKREYFSAKKLLLILPYMKFINDQNTLFILKTIESN